MPLIHVWDAARVEAVDDPPPDGRVDLVVIKPGGWNPGHLGRLVAGSQLPADDPAGKHVFTGWRTSPPA